MFDFEPLFVPAPQPERLTTLRSVDRAVESCRPAAAFWVESWCFVARSNPFTSWEEAKTVGILSRIMDGSSRGVFLFMSQIFWHKLRCPKAPSWILPARLSWRVLFLHIYVDDPLALASLTGLFCALGVTHVLFDACFIVTSVSICLLYRTRTHAAEA